MPCECFAASGSRHGTAKPADSSPTRTEAQAGAREARPDARDQAAFKAIWQKINYQTRYGVNLDSPEVIQRCVQALQDVNQYPRVTLPKIRAETLVMGTGTDFITPSYFSKALAQSIPGAKLVLYDDGGHSFTTTRAESFNRDCLEFLRK